MLRKSHAGRTTQVVAGSNKTNERFAFILKQPQQRRLVLPGGGGRLAVPFKAAGAILVSIHASLRWESLKKTQHALAFAIGPDIRRATGS